MNSVHLSLNQNRIKLTTKDLELFDEVCSHFTVPNPASRFSQFAPATLSAITLFGTFLPGMTADIVNKIKEIRPDTTFKIDDEVKSIINPFTILEDIGEPKNIVYEYRDYQSASIKQSLKFGRGISLLPTAAGKSLIVYGIVTNILKHTGFQNTVVLVPNLQLVTQMRDDLIDYGFDKNQISTFSSFSPKFEKKKQITITNRQWLEQFTVKEVNKRKKANTELRKQRTAVVNETLSTFSKFINKKDSNKKLQKSKQKYLKLLNLKNKSFEFVREVFIKDLDKKIKNNKDRIDNINKYIDDIHNFDCAIIDECHQLAVGNEVCKYIQKLDTNCIFGLTGTLPEKENDMWNVKGLIGPVLHTEEVYELQEKKFIANVKIMSILFEHSHVPKFVDYRLKDVDPIAYKEQLEKAFYKEWKHIESVDKSNEKIAQLTSKLSGNTLLLFDHTSHGNALYDAITSDNKFFIDGSVDVAIRDEIKLKMENNTGVILVGNVKAVGTGISIKNIDNIVFAISGKGVTKIIQAIGRGLRLMDGKTKVNLFDIYHNFYYSIKHAERRKDLYSKFYNILVNDTHTIKI